VVRGALLNVSGRHGTSTDQVWQRAACDKHIYGIVPYPDCSLRLLSQARQTSTQLNTLHKASLRLG
ncbi:MAG: hypothetical protein ACKO43_02520, partial [Alphaproteobacteria bacterium]